MSDKYDALFSLYRTDPVEFMKAIQVIAKKDLGLEVILERFKSDDDSVSRPAESIIVLHFLSDVDIDVLMKIINIYNTSTRFDAGRELLVRRGEHLSVEDIKLLMLTSDRFVIKRVKRFVKTLPFNDLQVLLMLDDEDRGQYNDILNYVECLVFKRHEEEIPNKDLLILFGNPANDSPHVAFISVKKRAHSKELPWGEISRSLDTCKSSVAKSLIGSLDESLNRKKRDAITQRVVAQFT